jgi:PucR family transcriptional regulator, purine catabolism regulatory protein
MTLSVRDVLEMRTVKRGRPTVVAGAAHLNRTVRWVHIADISGVAPLLKGSELLLTSGLGLPSDQDALRGYVSELADAGVAGVVMTVGWRYADIPAAMVEEAELRGLPMVRLEPVPFVEVTEQVHSEIIGRQLLLLRKAESIGRTFTELVLHGSSPRSLVEGLGRIVNRPVILETMAHQIVDVATTWEVHARAGHRSDAVPLQIDDGSDPAGCAWTAIPLRDDPWGRLHVLHADDQLDEIDRLALDRAGIAAALMLLSQRDADQLVDQVGADLIDDAVRGNVFSEADLFTRAQALGCDLRGHGLATVAVDADGFGAYIKRLQLEEAEIQQVKRAMLAVTRRAIEEEGCVGITAVDSDEVLAIVGVPGPGRPFESLDGLGRRVRELLPEATEGLTATVGISREIQSALGLAHAFQEARESVMYGKSVRGGAGVFHFEDLGVDSLILRLRDTAELSRFVEAELGPLLEHDASKALRLLPTLRAYVEFGRNKSAAAKALHLERRSLYHRLGKIEALLGRDLQDVETCTRLHVALKALAILRRGDGREPVANEPSKVSARARTKGSSRRSLPRARPNGAGA